LEVVMRKAAIAIALLIVLSAISVVFAIDNHNMAQGDLLLRHFPIDKTITYQGILKNVSGDPVPDANYNLTFRLYNASSGGASLWTSSVIPVTTTNGLFITQLGPIPLPFDTTYYLSIQVQSDPEMTQRQRLTMSPYSASSDTANSAFHADTAGMAQDVADNSITSQKIVNGTIQFSDIGQNGAANGQVMKWNGSAWQAKDDSTGPGNGWIDEGTWVGLATTSDTVSIGIPIPMEKLDVNGGLRILGKATLGPYHSNTGFYGFAAGYGDTVTADYGAAMGMYNLTNGMNSAVLSGYHNRASGVLSVVCGGSRNVVNSDSSFVGGGISNTTAGVYSAVGGGALNSANAPYSIVAGGNMNSVTGDYGFVGGGNQNLASGLESTVAGGINDTASASGSMVGGGQHNVTSGQTSTVGGGSLNRARGDYSTIAGGAGNEASGLYSAICGGAGNSASAYGGFIGGGINNYTKDYSVVCGGTLNCDSAFYSAIIGGYGDTISAYGGYVSMAFGRGVYVNDNYRIVFFDSLYPGSLNINRGGRDGTVYSYPLQVGTNSSNGNGAYLSAGGVWTNGSSRTFKENFTPFDGTELLRKISNLSVTTWNYRNSTEKHVGPVAEEFVGAFDTGVIRESDSKRDDQYLAAGDVAGVALAGVQELTKQIEELKKEIAELKAQQGGK
jgi:hypothetical protein